MGPAFVHIGFNKIFRFQKTHGVICPINQILLASVPNNKTSRGQRQLFSFNKRVLFNEEYVCVLIKLLKDFSYKQAGTVLSRADRVCVLLKKNPPICNFLLFLLRLRRGRPFRQGKRRACGCQDNSQLHL